MTGEKRNIITGGLILITLGVLIFISKTTTYGFGQSWPILLIVIGVSTLFQKAKDIGGWFITVVGIIFLFVEIYGLELSRYSQYIFPVVLVLLGIFVILKRRKHN
jgi:cadmium resistance protein CadD (predicted permease)